MVLKDATVRDVSKSCLDRVCTSTLDHTYDPSKTQLTELAMVVERYVPNIDRRTIMSAIRKWFRKRREEMGARVFQYCRSELRVPTQEIAGFVRGLRQNRQLLDTIIVKASIEIKRKETAREFVVEKIESFFRRKAMNYSIGDGY